MRRILYLLFISFAGVMIASAQSLDALWKQLGDLDKLDYKQTTLDILHKIQQEGEKQRRYDDVIYAMFKEMDLTIGDDEKWDSFEQSRIKKQEKWRKEGHGVAAAVCTWFLGDGRDKGEVFIDSLLSSKDSAEYRKPNGITAYPRVIKQEDGGKYFNNELLCAFCGDKTELLVKYYGADNLFLRWNKDKKKALSESDKARQVQLIDSLSDVWRDWEGVAELENQKRYITCPHYDMYASKMYSSNQDVQFYLRSVKNVSNIQVKVTPLTCKGNAKYLEFDEYGRRSKTLYGLTRKAMKSDQTKVFNFALDYLETRGLWENFDESVSIGTLPVGVYLVEVSSTNDPRIGYAKEIENGEFVIRVSDLRVMGIATSDDQVRLVCVNAVTGQPVANAKLDIKCYNETKTYSTDAKGECVLPDRANSMNIYPYTEDDTASLEKDITAYYNTYDGHHVSYQTDIFVDRSIYRPGQTVHVAVIRSMIEDGKKSKTLANQELTIDLKNSRNDNIEKKVVKTDEFGTATCDFVIPEDGITGQYNIVVDSESKYDNGRGNKIIRVEEYKCPQFDVTLEKPNMSYAIGDTIEVRGVAKAYSGAPVNYAQVVYSVDRSSMWWWARNVNGGTLLRDTVVTAADGSFVIKMPMTVVEAHDGVMPLSKACKPFYYCITAQVDVTNMAGETQRTELSLPLSNRKSILTCNVPKGYCTEEGGSVTIKRTNAAGQKIDGTVTVYIDGKKKATVAANTMYTFPNKIASGEHTFKAICEEDTVEGYFVVFSINDTKPVCTTHDWAYCSAKQFSEDNTPVTLQVGSSDKDMYIVYSIMTLEKELEHGVWTPSESLINRKFTYKPEYGDGITISWAWFKNGEYHSHSERIQRYMPSANLKMAWKTFRNKLLPGQKEEWTLSITDEKGKPVRAQVLATMYDKSLDALRMYSWSMTDRRELILQNAKWQAFRQYRNSLSKSAQYDDLKYTSMVVPTFNFYNYKLYCCDVSAPSKYLSRNISIGAMSTMAQANEQGESSDESVAGGTQQQEAEIDMRKDFAETAFFMPQLVSDNSGVTTLRFTLPQSVTTWKLMALAHDKQMRFDIINEDVVAQKVVMVQPNMPRFLRVGDKSMITATIVNLSDKDKTVKAGMALLDAATEKAEKSIYNNVYVKAGSTETVSFAVNPTEERDLICRFTAECDGSSDGEQHLLPILSDMEQVTTTRTYTLYAPVDTTLSFADAVPSGVEDTRMSVHYVDNPAWMMMEALPQISTPDCENVICLSTALYANVVSAALMNSLVEYKTDVIAGKLLNLQLADGSFAWWKGMEGSAYMTVAVAKTLLRMEDIAGKQDNLAKLIRSAMSYLDKVASDRVKDIKDKKYQGYVGGFLLDYLYSRALYSKLYKESATSDVNYLVNYAYKNLAKADIESKAMAAIVFAQYKKTKEAKEYVESIKQHTSYRADIGRYFNTRRAAYSWCNYRIPAQTMAIEAMQMVTPNDKKTIADMKRWLLSSKRTQQWDTPYNTVNAVHAFFGNDKSVLSTPKNDITLTDKPLAKAEDATVTVNKSSDCESWVSTFITYKQNVNDVQSDATGLTVTREVTSATNVGDKVKVKITVTADRDYDFVTVTDQRAACLEPVNQLSGYSYGCYREMRDNRVAYHFNKLSKGKHTVETEYYVNQWGDYTSGIATAVCAYAPEFSGTTGAYSIQIKK